MPRIETVNETTALPEAQALLGGVKQSLGMVPNLFATMAHAPAVLEGHLAFSQALGKGVLSKQLREQIALTIAGANGCDYCASAHTALGSMAGLDADELQANLGGVSNDPSTQAALGFAKAIVSREGHVTDGDLDAIRAAGYSEQAIVEIVAHVAINIFTNYFNHVAHTVIDFSPVHVA